MNWNTRKYFDDETRKKISESITDESLLAQVMSVYEDSMNAVDRKEVETQDRYANIAKLLEQTSAVSGVSQEHLLTITRRIAVSSRDTEWYQVLSMIDTFFRIRDALLKDEQ